MNYLHDEVPRNLYKHDLFGLGRCKYNFCTSKQVGLHITASSLQAFTFECQTTFHRVVSRMDMLPEEATLIWQCLFLYLIQSYS